MTRAGSASPWILAVLLRTMLMATLPGGVARAADSPPQDAVPLGVTSGAAPAASAPPQPASSGRVLVDVSGAAALPPPPSLPRAVSPAPGRAGQAPSGPGTAAGDGAKLSGLAVSGVRPPSGADGLGRAGLSGEPASMPALGGGFVPTPSVSAASMPKPPPVTPSPVTPSPNTPAPVLTAAQQALITTGLASVMVRPGEAQVFPVSAGRVNRIVTPFAHAKVSSDSSGGIEVRDGVLYVTPSGDGPMSMWVTEDGRETVAINLTLVPARIPPVHLVLQLPADVTDQMAARQGGDRRQADAFERGHPYVEMVRSLMRALALGQVPNGYELQATIPTGISPPHCAAGGVRVDFSGGQYLLGSSIEVLVGVVSNRGPAGVDFTESFCGEPGVLAVALSPSPLIPPGGASEIYVARRLASPDAPRAQPRPSLVSGGN
jgi:conjugal transfer pilus assembly protein TraK